MRFSQRLPQANRPNALFELLAKKRDAGERILDLTESNPTHAGIAYPSDLLKALAHPGALLYEPEPFGMPAAREAIAEEHGVRAENVVLTASTSEAYSWLFKLLCDPGDEVLTPRPSYPLFEYLAALESVRVRHYGLFYDHGWFIDFHALTQAITERTRAIVLVNPNNPTGHFIRRHEAAELAQICEHHNLALISDEVFSGYAIDPPPDSVISLTGVADFTLHGLSKASGLPQLKLAWIIARESPEPLEMIADTYLSAGAPVQWALPALLQAGISIRKQIHGRAIANLAKLPRCLKVEAGWYAVVPVLDEEETALKLLRDQNVLVQPGYFYDFERSGYLVLSLLTPADVFEEALRRVSGGRGPLAPWGELYD